MANKYININYTKLTIYGLVSEDELKNKQSMAKIGTIGNATGSKHSEETKNKKRKKVLVLNLDGTTFNTFNSVSEVGNYFSVNISAISNRLNKNKEYKGFIFKTKNEIYEW